MTLSLISLLAVLFLTFGGFLLSTIAGFGGSLVLVSVLAFFYDVDLAVAASAPVMLANNLGKAGVFFRHIDWKAAFTMLFGTLPGAWIGAALLISLPAGPLKKLVGILLLLGVVVSFTRDRQRFRIGKVGLFVMSILYGFFSGLAGAGGPTKALALATYGLSKERFVGTAALVSFCSALIKIPIYHAGGLFPSQTRILILFLILSCFVAISWGRLILARLQESRFRWLLASSILASCVKIIFL